jgi:predicted transcriptional regulator
METRMTSVTLSVATREDVSRRARAAFKGEHQGAYISFGSLELLMRTLTVKRWEILQALTGQSEMSIREVARRVGRDVKAVHGDVTALIQAGVIDRTDGGVVFPYDSVHVDFTLTKAKALNLPPPNVPQDLARRIMPRNTRNAAARMG